MGVAVAVQTSLRAVLMNPATMGLWGLIVGGLLALGFATLLVGLAIIMPVLGHATWICIAAWWSPTARPLQQVTRPASTT